MPRRAPASPRAAEEFRPSRPNGESSVRATGVLTIFDRNGRAIGVDGRGTDVSKVTPNSESSAIHRTLDELDRQIIRILQKNGRAPNTELARELGVTETTIRNRVTRLLAEGLIEIIAMPTPKAIGSTLSAMIGISTSIGKVYEVAEQLVRRREVRYVGLSTGRFDIIIEAFFDGHEHLLNFIADDIGSMTGVVDLETSIMLKIEKFSYEWEVY